MKVIHNICCEDIIRDVSSNSISLIKIIEQINSEGFPIFIPKINLFYLIQKDNNDKDTYPAKLIFNLNNKVLKEIDFAIKFQSKKSTRNIIQILGIAIPEPGTLVIKLSVKNKILSNLKLPIHLSNKISTEST